MTVIRVRGVAEVLAEPDRAQLSIVLTADDQHADAALAALGQKSSAANAVLDEFEIAASSRRTSAANLQRNFEWIVDRNVDKGYRATLSTTVDVAELANLGRLMTAIAARVPTAEVHGPSWSASPDRPEFRTVRSLAVADARERAEDYAVALGLNINAVVEASEPAVSASMRTDFGGPEGARMMKAAAFDAGPEFNAGLLSIAASIDVTFTAE